MTVNLHTPLPVLRWNIGGELNLQPSDLVFELQFAFLQTTQMQFIGITRGARGLQLFYGKIKVSVLNLQFDNTLGYFIQVTGHANILVQ